MSYELRRASLIDSPLPDHTTFRDWGRMAARDNVYPIAFLYFHYQRVRPGITAEEAIEHEGRQVTGVREDAFETREAFAVTPLFAQTYRGAETHFRFDTSELYFSNDPRGVKTINVDFGDGEGLRTVPSVGEVVVHYPSTGHKLIQVQMTLEGGTVRFGRTDFEVLELRTPGPTETWPMQASIPYNGSYSSGEAYVYLADGHNAVVRPVVVSEGFDYDNTMNWDALYALLNQQELLETIRSMGYDLVVLNYADAVAPIQANAYLVEALLDSVNHVVASGTEFVLVGASMGGLTTRFALTDMEANQHPHHVRTWISYDSPHRGANIPLGVQYWMDFFASESSDAAYLRDILNSPAARQMLVVHFTNPASNTASSDPLRAVFLNDLAQIGNFPNLPRTVAMANGSGYQTGEDFAPADQLIRWEYSSFLLDITGNVWALPNAQAHNIFVGVWNPIWPLPDHYLTVNLQPTWPWDNAPGGWKNSMAVMDAIDPGTGDIIALHPNHCFIPTISSLDLAVDDPFHPIAGDPNLYSLTEFDSLYFPVENQEHVDITPESFWWLLEEAVGPLASPVVVIKPGNGTVRLDWPPVDNARSYHVYESEDGLTWPSQYLAISDTTWTDTDLTPLLKFYRVTSSLESVAIRRQ
jgi:hypothetical protein